ALARALIHQPQWLLADEPTGSLDEHNAEQVMALMMTAVRGTGAGLLLVSHNPAYGALADRVLRLEGGQLVELKGRRHD
ncbi:TPA: ABC transporter ATP-binding protein, partial [Aeromonas hydrophila]|nr:ABC transporter ATP-binding protein [Aeromonas hydrophila]